MFQETSNELELQSELPVVDPMDPMTGIVDNPGMTTTKVDTTLTFTGVPSELPGLWFHVDMKALLDATLSTDERKSAYYGRGLKYC
jgi:hypothetical protein